MELFSTLGTIKTLYFNSLNITSFLKMFKLAYKSYYISTLDRVTILSYYYNTTRKIKIEILLEITNDS